MTGGRGKRESKEKEDKQDRDRKTIIGDDNKKRQNQTTSCYICRNQTESILRHLWGNQVENHHEHLQVDKQREKKNQNKTRAAITPAATQL